MHKVMTATRSHIHAAPEYADAELDPCVIPGKDMEAKRAGAAEIISVGVGNAEQTHRLALSKGRHVDVDRVWFNRNAPRAGQFYVQDSDGNASVADMVFPGRLPSANPVTPPPQPPKSGLPSAEDLDAAIARAAQEQRAAEDTQGNARGDDGSAA